MRRSIGIVIASLAAAEAFAADTIPVSGTVLSRFVGGRTVLIDTPLGTQMPISYRPDGTLAGRAGQLSFYLGSDSDTGRWWIKGDKVCQKWKRWFDGDITCLRIRHQGRRLFWQSDDGKSGTGMLTGPAPEELLADARSVHVPKARHAATASATVVASLEADSPVPHLVKGPVLVREGRMVRNLITLAIARSVVTMEPLPNASRIAGHPGAQDAWCKAASHALAPDEGTKAPAGSADAAIVEDGLATWFEPAGPASPSLYSGVRFGCLAVEPGLVTVARLVAAGK